MFPAHRFLIKRRPYQIVSTRSCVFTTFHGSQSRGNTKKPVQFQFLPLGFFYLSERLFGVVTPAAGTSGAMSGAGATTVPRWRSRRLEREETKNVLQKLDSFVPQHKRRAAQSNGAGARSIGAQGRTLNDVLADVVEHIRTMKHDRESCSICREQPRACSKKHSAKAEQLGATHSGHLRERERMLARMLTSDDRILTAQVCLCARVRLAQGAAGFRPLACPYPLLRACRHGRVQGLAVASKRRG